MTELTFVGLGTGAGDASLEPKTTWTKLGGDALNNSCRVNTFEGILRYLNSTLPLWTWKQIANDAEVWSWDGSSWTKNRETA